MNNKGRLKLVICEFIQHGIIRSKTVLSKSNFVFFIPHQTFIFLSQPRNYDITIEQFPFSHYIVGYSEHSDLVSLAH